MRDVVIIASVTGELGEKVSGEKVSGTISISNVGKDELDDHMPSGSSYYDSLTA